MLMCCISEYFRLLIVAQGVRDAVQEAVISTVNDNYDDVYHGVREGYSGAYQPLAGDFEESLDYGDIYGRLDDILGLTYRGGYHTQYTEDGGMEFRVWGLDVEIRNAPFASGDSAGDRFVADPAFCLQLKAEFGAISCEMETGAVAQVCAVNKTPFCGLRAISDNANDEGSVDFETFAKSSAEKCIELLKDAVGELNEVQ